MSVLFAGVGVGLARPAARWRTIDALRSSTGVSRFGWTAITQALQCPAVSTAPGPGTGTSSRSPSDRSVALELARRARWSGPVHAPPPLTLSGARSGRSRSTDRWPPARRRASRRRSCPSWTPVHQRGDGRLGGRVVRDDRDRDGRRCRGRPWLVPGRRSRSVPGRRPGGTLTRHVGRVGGPAHQAGRVERRGPAGRQRRDREADPLEEGRAAGHVDRDDHRACRPRR